MYISAIAWPYLPKFISASPPTTNVHSEISQVLLSSARGGEADINIQDKRTESYTKPKPKLVAFSGQGQNWEGNHHNFCSWKNRLSRYFSFFQLCSWSCLILHSWSSAATTGGEVEAGSSVNLAPPTVPLNPTQPTTTVQIRLADGMRLVSKFNHTHTVNDIR